MTSEILAVGWALPERVVSSAELEARLGRPAGSIEARTGIRARRQAADGELAYHLGAAAARQALGRAGLAADGLDAILFATTLCDYVSPGSAVLIQRELGGSRPVAAFDLRDQSAGFVYALSLADALVTAGRARHVLVVGAERQHENFLACEPTAALLGDAGGAALVGPSGRGGHRLLATDIGADGRGAAAAIVSCENVEAWAPEHRHHAELRSALAEAAGRPAAGAKLYYWNEGEVRRALGGAVIPSVRAVLAKAGATVRDVDWFLFPDGTLEARRAVEAELGLDPARCPSHHAQDGHTGTAALPLLLGELEADGVLRPGQLVLLASFGAGYAWGAAAVRW